MAKGKEALKAANRRLEASHAHIDRLTDELAAVKIRMRDAEAKAASLERTSDATARAIVQNDELLKETVAKLKWWEKWAREDRRSRLLAARDLVWKVWPDIAERSGQRIDVPFEDRRQFFAKRYPQLLEHLTYGGTAWMTTNPDRPQRNTMSSYARVEQGMDPERLRKFQRLTGQRAIWEEGEDRDVAEVIIDLLDAKQAGFTPDEMMELVSD